MQSATGTLVARISLSAALGRLAAGLLPPGTPRAKGTDGTLHRPSDTEFAFTGRGGSWPERYWQLADIRRALMSAALGRKSNRGAASGNPLVLSPVRADTMRHEPLPVTGNTLAGKGPLICMLVYMIMLGAVDVNGVRLSRLVSFMCRRARRNLPR